MRALTTALLGTLVATLATTGCGDDDDPPRPAVACERTGVIETILDNHPRGSHVLDVPTSDVAAAVAVTYDIQGNNTGHGHFVTVATPELATLARGGVVSLTSSDTGAVGMDHTHPVILDCSQ